MKATNEWQKASVRQRLIDAEAELVQIDRALALLKLDFELASKAYAALREFFEGKFGESPYTGDWAVGKQYTCGPTEDDVAPYGIFRFTHMMMGAAVVNALKHLGPTESIDEIVDYLEEGGLEAGDNALDLRYTVSQRAVNAALRRTTGVERDAEGRYYIEGYTEQSSARRRVNDQAESLT